MMTIQSFASSDGVRVDTETKQTTRRRDDDNEKKCNPFARARREYLFSLLLRFSSFSNVKRAYTKWKPSNVCPERPYAISHGIQYDNPSRLALDYSVGVYTRIHRYVLYGRAALIICKRNARESSIIDDNWFSKTRNEKSWTKTNERTNTNTESTYDRRWVGTPVREAC